MELIRCRQCGTIDDRDLYAEGGYHDVTCMACGARSGKYGDENAAINLWNGKGIKFHLVVWQGQLHGFVLEMYDDKATADSRAKYFNHMIRGGQSPMGYKLDPSRGIRETVSVDTIEPNKKFEGMDLTNGERKIS